MKPEENKDRSVVWIMNEHGVRSSKESWLAKQLLKDHPDWQYCDPDVVPEVKAYPLTGGSYTETGRERRQAANVSSGLEENGGEPPKTEYTWQDIKKLAKAKGITSFGKTRATLMAELEL